MSKKSEDLGIKIGTKEESFWSRTFTQACEAQEQNLHEIAINKAIEKLAIEMIDIEKSRDR